MKNLHIFLFILVVSFMTSSCFLFRPSHERCPAYGEIQKEYNPIEVLDHNQDEQI